MGLVLILQHVILTSDLDFYKKFLSLEDAHNGMIKDASYAQTHEDKKMKKSIITTFFLVAVLLTVVYYSRDVSQPAGNGLVNSIKDSVETSKKKVDLPISSKVPSVSPATIDSLDDIVSLQALEVAKNLQPPSDDEMESIWQYSYGCGKLPDDHIESCTFDILFNAETLAEAQWMKRNGFPHRGMIEQLRDQSSHEAIAELANNNFKPAVALAALSASSLGIHDDAVRWAAKFRTLSSPSDVYAHRLYGDVLAAEDPLNSYALQSYLIAEYLGDYDANAFVLTHSYDQPTHIRLAVEGAQHFINNNLGINVSDLPLDPRPGGG